ncbi:MAG: flavodoxin [Candidatus Margulisiibacteriota bacterium]
MHTKTLVVYYSLEGNTQFVAETIAAILRADILKIQPQKEINAGNFMKYLWGGRQVVMRETPTLLPLDKNPNDYDTLIIGTPVWAFTFAPPLRTFLSENKIIGKKIGLFCTHEGVPGHTLQHMKNLLPDNQFIGALEINLPIKKNPKKIIAAVEDWARGLRLV